MVTFYLALSIFLVAVTTAAVDPRLFGRHLDTPLSFAAMILVLALPQFVVAAVLFTFYLWWHGDLLHPVGMAGFAIQVVCGIVLARYAFATHGALPVLDGRAVQDTDQPFCEGFTDDERQQLQPGAVSWRPSFTYQVPAMLAVSVARDVIYREVAGVKLRVDIYRPRQSSTSPHPTVLYVHGGGWVAGTRRQSRFMMYELAAAGSVVFSISYRLAPWHRLPAALEDVKAAVAWVRAHASSYGADPKHITVMGGSAGGHLAAMVALTPNEPRFQPGFESEDTRVQGAVILYGATDLESSFGAEGSTAMAILLERLVFGARFRDDPERFRALAPITYARADAPPMLFVHGAVDRVVPISHSHRTVARLREVGAQKVHLLEVPFGQHAFEVFPSPLHQRSVRVIVRFLEGVRRGRVESTADVKTVR